MEQFRLKRTKMVDEAALNHKPQPLFSSFWIFVLVNIIASAIGSFIATIPTLIWMLFDAEFIGFMKEYMAQAMNGELNEEYLNSFVASYISNIPWWVLLVSILSSASFIVVAIFYCKKFEKRSIASLGIFKKGFIKEYSFGALIGILMAALTYLIAFLSGGVSIKLNGEGFSFAVILFLVGFIIQGASREIFYRGYYMITIARDYKVAAAVSISSIVFALMEGGMTFLSIINILLLGIFLGIYVFKRGDIFGASAIHAMWCFVQGNVFGTSVRGLKILPSIFTTTLNEGKELANGGVYGLEGGIASTIVLLIAIGVIFLVKEKKGIVSITEETRLD